ncbi:MAG: hypothetical protein K2X77_07355 [Candidatus Obscuribacterales bacterium]|jgi:hypothetical protein|nr:hypothetical protein [Candidatus Obscuribacterales bacterium]
MASGEQANKGDDKSEVQIAFAGLKHDDPFFIQLKQLLLMGKRAEAIKLIQTNYKFDTPEAQELTKLIMGTLQDTMIDP